MMTEKHFKKFAEMLSDIRTDYPELDPVTTDFIEYRMCLLFGTENPNFDRTKFHNAAKARDAHVPS